MLTFNISDAVKLFITSPKFDLDCRLGYDLIRMYNYYSGDLIAFLDANPAFNKDIKALADSFSTLHNLGPEGRAERTMEIILNS